MLNALELHKYLKASADKADLRIVYESTAAPRTDGKTVWLPHVGIYTTEEQAKVLKHFVNHESSHVKRSDFELLREEAIDATNSPLGALWNMIEDDRVDYQNCIEYEGDRESAAYAYEESMGKIVASMKKGIHPSKQHVVDFIGPALAWNCDMLKDIYPNSQQTRDDVVSCLSKKGKEYYDKFMKNGYHKQLKEIQETDGLKGTKKSLELSERIYREVYGLDPEKEKKRRKEEQECNGKGKGKGKAGDKEAQGAADPNSSGKGGDERLEDKEYGIIDVDFSEMLPSTHEFKPDGTINNKGTHLIYPEHAFSRVAFKQTPLDKYNVTDYTKKAEFNGPAELSGYRSREISDLLRGVGFDGFANKVRIKLQIRSKGRTQYGLKQGKLHKGAVHRVTLKDVGGLDERIFKKKIKSDVLDSAVQIIVDASGSMSGAKFAHAAASAALLNQTIGNVLHIPCEIIAFSHHSVSDMFIIRDFDTQQLATENLIARFSDVSAHMYNNSDGEAVLFGYNRIAKRKEKRKLMIVLSDGSPAAGGGDVVGYTSAVIDAIQDCKRVDIVGIGIQDSNVKRFYKEHYVLKNIEDLEPALLSLIDKKLR